MLFDPSKFGKVFTMDFSGDDWSNQMPTDGGVCVLHASPFCRKKAVYQELKRIVWKFLGE